MVILAVHILSTGQVDNIRLKKSSGYSRLDNAAIAAVKKWRYIPARQGNTPIPFWHTQAVRFSLTD
ncbi:MAG: energy transducer TonB [Oxalobacter formigenes]|nr:energy transducer TonB [Oxalobacter formigenes]